MDLLKTAKQAVKYKKELEFLIDQMKLAAIKIKRDLSGFDIPEDRIDDILKFRITDGVNQCEKRLIEDRKED